MVGCAEGNFTAMSLDFVLLKVNHSLLASLFRHLLLKVDSLSNARSSANIMAPSGVWLKRRVPGEMARFSSRGVEILLNSLVNSLDPDDYLGFCQMVDMLSHPTSLLKYILCTCCP